MERRHRGRSPALTAFAAAVAITTTLPPVAAASRPVPDPPPVESVARWNARTDFRHATGGPGHAGWEADHKSDRTGYLLAGLNRTFVLPPGAYRLTVRLRRGHYPDEGFLRLTGDLVRIEVRERGQNRLIAERTLQAGDLARPNRFEERWIEFAVEPAAGRPVDFRVYWFGDVNGEIETVRLVRFPPVRASDLEDKALRIGRRIRERHLENGFVVSRRPDGRADEIGDATTYTGWYVASLAWRYGATGDESVRVMMEDGIRTLRSAVAGSPERPYLARFINERGEPHPEDTSKDVYTSFFFAYATAFPFVKDPALRDAMRADVRRIGDRFLQDDLTVRQGGETAVTLAPYFTENEVRHGINKLFEKREHHEKVLAVLRALDPYRPFMDVWPGFEPVVRSLRNGDANRLFELAIPTMNGVLTAVQRAARALGGNPERRSPLGRIAGTSPGRRLGRLFADALSRIPEFEKSAGIDRLSDLKVLAGNAVITLHLMKSAAEITGAPQFESYYRTNLYTQDALLDTALNWFGFEEAVFRMAAGNPAADRARRGGLSALSLFNLVRLERNPTIRGHYRSLFKRWWISYRHEDNPMAIALAAIALPAERENVPTALITRGLGLFPEDRHGFGNAFWKRHGIAIGERLGGGVAEGHAREPLPISHRPKDAFLWQRNGRRLRGDAEKEYPGVDYLFVYWMARHYGLIEPPTIPATVRR